jgi:hypothetical protein
MGTTGHPPAELTVAKERIGNLELTMSFQPITVPDPAAPGFGRGELSVRAATPWAEPVPGVALRATSATPGVKLGPLQARADGSYRAAVDFPLAESSMNVQVASVDPDADAWTARIFDLPQRPAARVYPRLELGLVPSLLVTSRVLGLGGGVAAELAWAIRLGPGALVISARPGYEGYSARNTGPVPCAGQPGCPIASGSSYNLRTHAFTLPLLGIYRLERAGGGQGIYAGLGPVLAVSRSIIDAPAEGKNDDLRRRLGFVGLVGGQLRAGRGAFFLEVAGRYLPSGHPVLDDANLAELTLSLGYRVSAR